MKFIETQIIMEATGALMAQIDKELGIEDPELEEALAVLKNPKQTNKVSSLPIKDDNEVT